MNAPSSDLSREVTACQQLSVSSVDVCIVRLLFLVYIETVYAAITRASFGKRTCNFQEATTLFGRNSEQMFEHLSEHLFEQIFRLNRRVGRVPKARVRR